MLAFRMHIVLDILAAIILLFFFLSGWHKGFLLSLLGVVRVVLAYGAAYFAGRYLGFWLGEVANRPRIIMIPVIAGLTFVIITFVFHVGMSNLRAKHLHLEEHEDFQHTWYSRLGGSTINLTAGLFSLIFLFWLGDLFMVGVSGQSIPGSSQASFGRLARRSIYEATYRLVPKNGNESQAAAVARGVSNPAKGVEHLKAVLATDSMQQLMSDRQFANDLMSGDPHRIGQNASLQRLFDDRATLDKLRAAGLLSGKEKKAELCEKLSRFGRNENIRTSLENLKDKDLLNTGGILLLIRDPDFDVIIAEGLK